MNWVTFVLLLVASSAALAFDDREDKFMSYAARFGKNYNVKELPIRMALYTDRREKIRQHNAEAAAGKQSYTMEENHLADRSLEEIAMQFGTIVESGVEVSRSALNNGPFLEDRQLPPQVDYRSDKCLPAVENQAKCGSCWAFGATVPLEWQYCSKYNKSITLSKQQLVSCSSAYGNNGCNGGFYTNAWEYIIAAGGIASAASYPYSSGSGVTATCSFSAAKAAAKVSSWRWVYPYYNENAMAAAVTTYGPISVAIYANTNFAYYKSGIFNDPNCPTNMVNHAVVVVGYGTDATRGDYWIIRNSWGSSWGLSGYILMKRGVNMCAINGWGAYPTVA